MLKRLANKLAMFEAVQSHLNANKSMWTSVPAMVETINDFESLLAEIETCWKLTSVNKKGITLQKAAQQALVIAHTYELSSLLYAMASKKNDAILVAKVDFTETDLLKKRDNNLVTTCLNMVEIATEHLAGLIDYQVSGDELIVLKEEIKRFADNIATGRVTVSERKAANVKLKDLFVQVNALLKNQLDRIMVRYRKNEPKFYSSYQNIRRVVNYGVRHEKPKEPKKEA
jgi:uncharacterized circularly permuted ATP-grasp superfamily protein